MPQHWRRRLYVSGFLVLAFLVGSTAQEQLGISFSVEGLEAFRQWVQSLGWWGPVVFILLVIFRLFIGLSSHVILTLGGLAFGVTGGIVWGSIGIFCSALVLYYLAQQSGSDWVRRRFGNDYQLIIDRIERIGAMAIFAITAHPLGLLSPAHLAAGLAGLSPGGFATAVALSAPLRATPYAVLGTAVLDMTLAQSLWITAALLLVFALPLLIPSVRVWVWTTGSAKENPDSGRDSQIRQ